MMSLNAKSVLADSKIENLEENKTYKIDLDRDGKKETISYKLIEDSDTYSTYKIIINKKEILSIENLYYTSYPEMKITDIDTKDGVMDIWVEAWGESGDRSLFECYQYKKGKLRKITIPDYKETGKEFIQHGCELYKIEKNGKFYIRVRDAFDVQALIGDIDAFIPYQLKNGKITTVKTNTYSAHIFTTDKKLTAARKLTLYKKADTSSGTAFTVKKGEKLKPAADRADLLTITFFVARDEIFISPVLAEVGNQRKFINLELFQFRSPFRLRPYNIRFKRRTGSNRVETKVK